MSIKSYLSSLLEAFIKNKRSYISNQAAASTKTISYSGNFTAPADGYVHLKLKTTNTSNPYFYLYNDTTPYGYNLNASSLSLGGCAVWLFVPKGAAVSVLFYNCTLVSLTFTYSQGYA